MIVLFATSIIRGVLAIGTGFAYMQMLVLAVLVAMVGTVSFAVIVTLVKSLMMGK